MKLVVLAAGQGSRLLPLTAHVPKPLIRLPDGTSLLERLITGFSGFRDLEEILVVGGHHIDRLEHAALEIQDAIPIRVVFNPFYDLSGPLGSLWAVHEEIRGADTMIANGDTLLGRVALGAICESAETMGDGVRLVVSKRAEFVRDDMLVSLNSEGRLIAVGKDIPRTHVDAVSVGVLALRGAVARHAFADALEGLLRAERQARAEWPWHSLLNVLAAEGTQIDTVLVPESSWREVDSLPDLNEAQRMLSDNP